MFRNPIILFIWSIVSKWYIAVVITALVVTFWVFKGLNKAGVLAAAEEVIFRAFSDSKSIAQHCVPKILDLQDFWSCVNSPPRYEPGKDELLLQKKLTDFLTPTDNGSSQDIKNPYEE
jgi:hypothetical protein